MVMVDFSGAGGEHMVPKKDHLLFQYPPGADQVVEPRRAAHAWGGYGPAVTRVVPEELQPVRAILGFGV